MKMNNDRIEELLDKEAELARFRPATLHEIQLAGSGVSDREDWGQAKAYATALFGPTVARVQLVIDHNNDDGEESLYVMGGFYGSHNPASYETVQCGGMWFQPDDLHRGWDAAGNELPLLPTIKHHHLYDAEDNDIETPDFNEYDHWHMEFDFTEEPELVTLYVKE
jgi:hypothetical protein